MSLAEARVFYDLKEGDKIAQVNEWALYKRDFDLLMQAVAKHDAQSDMNNVLAGVISREALAQTLRQKQALPSLSEQKLQKQFEQFKAEYSQLNEHSEAILFSIFQNKAIQTHYLKEIGLINEIHEAKEALHKAAAAVSDEEVKHYYDAHKSELTKLDTAKVQHIQLKTEKMAKEVYAKLQAGMNFDEAVRQYSLAKDRHLKIAGNLGTIKNGDLSASLVKRMALLTQLHQVSKPMRVAKGQWHIFYVRQQHYKLKELDSSLRFKISHKLAHEQIRQNYSAFMKKVMQDSDIHLNQTYVKRRIF